DPLVTGVQTCALPICSLSVILPRRYRLRQSSRPSDSCEELLLADPSAVGSCGRVPMGAQYGMVPSGVIELACLCLVWSTRRCWKIGRAAGRERVGVGR